MARRIKAECLPTLGWAVLREHDAHEVDKEALQHGIPNPPPEDAEVEVLAIIAKLVKDRLTHKHLLGVLEVEECVVHDG